MSGFIFNSTVVSSQAKAARRLHITVAEYKDRTEHGQCWCRLHHGWVVRSEMQPSLSQNVGICAGCRIRKKSAVAAQPAEGV